MKVCSVCKRCFDEPADSCIEIDHPPLSDSLTGDRLMVPGYSLDQLLASCVKANAFRARRLDCGRSCIIRVVSTDAKGEERFLGDSKLVSTLFDSRVVDIYEVGTLRGGECFVVEEDCEEATLRSRLESVGFPDLLTSVRVVEQAAEALHALHIKGLTHGAVRPENIHLNFDADGLPILKLRGIDLGGVIARNAITNKFLIDSALDAIRYFAPEQCSGEAATAQTDVYSLGIVFFELVAGAPPFDAPKASALINMHLSQRPPDVKIEDLELRMLVAHSLSESLQKQPSFRQSSADLFARQMRLMEQLATHVSTPPPAVLVPAASPKPQSLAFTCPAPTPVPDPAPVVLNSAPEAAIALEPDSEPAILTSEYDIEEPVRRNQILPSSWLERDFAPEPADVSVGEEGLICATELEDLDPPESANLDPSSKPSALAAHRQRLKLRKRRSRPAAETKAVEVESAVITLRDEQDPDPIEAPRPVVASTQAAVAEARDEDREGWAAIPKLIGWEQPDDTPSLDEIPDHTPVNPFVSASGLSIPEANAFDHQPETHLVQWEQPEDDIPSIEDVIEVQSKEGSSISSIFQFEPEDIGVVPGIKHKLSADLRESVPAIGPEPQSEPASRNAIEFDFVPTILGGKPERNETAPLQTYSSIFSAYEESAKTPRSVPYRSISIGIGLMTVAALLGLGGDPVWRFISTPETAEPVTAAASVEKQKIPVQRVRPAIPDPVETESEPPAIDEYIPPGSLNDVSSVDEGPEPIRSKPSVAKPRRQDRKDPAPTTTTAPPSTSVPFSPSTVVITYGKGNIQRSDSPANRSSEKVARPAAERAPGATRPRIVSAPQR